MTEGDIYTRLGVIDNRLINIERHLEKQNNRMEKTEDKIEECERRLVGIETRCQLVNRYAAEDFERLEKYDRENKENIMDLVKQYGTVLLSVLVLLNMIGSWVGWW